MTTKARGPSPVTALGGNATSTHPPAVTGPSVARGDPVGGGALFQVIPVSVHALLVAYTVPPCGPASVTLSRSVTPVTARPARPVTSKRRWLFWERGVRGIPLAEEEVRRGPVVLRGVRVLHVRVGHRRERKRLGGLAARRQAEVEGGIAAAIDDGRGRRGDVTGCRGRDRVAARRQVDPVAALVVGRRGLSRVDGNGRPDERGGRDGIAYLAGHEGRGRRHRDVERRRLVGVHHDRPIVAHVAGCREGQLVRTCGEPLDRVVAGRICDRDAARVADRHAGQRVAVRCFPHHAGDIAWAVPSRHQGSMCPRP